MAETKLSSFKDKRWSLQGMTALVTGGTRGIGYATVEELAEFGAAVHICSRNEQDINKCLEEWKNKGFKVTGSVCDLLFRDQREKLMETVASVFNRKLNILINNAGIFAPKPILDYTVEDIATIMSINFVSSYHLCQLAHPLLKESGYGSRVYVLLKSLDRLKSIAGVDNVVEDIVSQSPVGRMGESKDISGLVAFLCLPASSHITGQIIAADGGFTM